MACAAVVLTALAPTAAQPAHAATALNSDAGAAAVSLYAGNAGTESSGESVTVTVSIGNSSSNVVGPGTATISLTEKPLATRDSLNAWLKPDGDHASTRVIATTPTQGVTAGTNQRVATVTIPAAAVGLSGPTAVYGLQATVTSSGGTVGTGYSTLAYVGDGVQQSVGLAIAMPITVPPTSSGLIAADDLATYTAPDGLLTRQLEVARDHPSIAIAIDPMIIASIRVYGSSAPASAQNWLNELDNTLSNDSFPLQYGDADVASQLQSGITSLLSPTSFGYAMDPRNFPAPLEVGETPQPTPTTGTNPFVTPTPTATQPTSNVPTTAQLLSWPYTYSGIAWPADASLRTSDVEALAKSGYQSTIISGSNTNQTSLSTTPNAPLPVKGGTALVTDQGVSTALRAVVSAATTDEQNAALASVSAQLAEIGEHNSGGVILAGLDRDWPTNAADTTRALSSVFSLPWVTTSSLHDALAAPASDGLELTDVTQDGTRTAGVQTLSSAAGRLDAFSTVLTDPTVLTGRTRNQLLSLLGVGWRQPDNNWGAAVAEFQKQASDTVASVQIEPTGKITVASAQSLIPVTVTNKFSLPVNIVLTATPSNGRLDVESDTAKTIPAATSSTVAGSAKVLVPVKARLGNGSVKLGLQLYSPTGLPIGSPQTSSIEVHADWEGLGALILGIAVVLFFGFGLTRSIVRRVRSRGKPADAGDSEPLSDGTTATDDPAHDPEGTPDADAVTAEPSSDGSAGDSPGSSAAGSQDAAPQDAGSGESAVGTGDGTPRG
ncbi:hypothetical protein HII28_11955 [Planctomonas sp. JC2975]|uniref:DUF6049 family protein n=1 Tax=Planctomonas sp. JC2975 TaxID=2729626 RepID=UPI001474DC7F|nr:DUF6049 family protein [Planctomonas sp. JC2975]NNC12589.1 hypothetical protein [Planctomonas sp. JC2975]